MPILHLDGYKCNALRTDADTNLSPVAGRLLHPRFAMTGLEQTVERFCDAWNRHDLEALTAMWAEEGELNHPWGFRAVGRAEVLDLLAREHAGSMADSSLSVVRVAAEGDDQKVIADLDAVLSNVRAPHGRPYDLEHRMSAMFVRAGEEWQIRTLTVVPNPRR